MMITTSSILPKIVDNSKYSQLPSTIRKFLAQGLNLFDSNHKQHPIQLCLKRLLNSVQKSCQTPNSFLELNPDNCVMTIEDNFDKLLIPKDHTSRLSSDSYYVDDSHVLCTQMTAHYPQVLLKYPHYNKFAIYGPVFRNDTMDCTHYPIFHQLDVIKLVDRDQLSAGQLLDDLKNFINKTLVHFFDSKIEVKFEPDRFPFTDPSLEVQIAKCSNQDPLIDIRFSEVAGCGIMKEDILHSSGRPNQAAWAIGFGLERLAMRLYDIDDIRNFWISDNQILKQFEDLDSYNSVISCKKASKFPAIKRHLSFFIDQRDFKAHDFLDIVRISEGNEIIESCELIDEYVNRKGQRSQTYELIYRHLKSTLSHDIVEKFCNDIIMRLKDKYKVKIR